MGEARNITDEILAQLAERIQVVEGRLDDYRKAAGGREDLLERVEDLLERVERTEIRLQTMERTIGQLGSAYIALGSASSFAANQARTIGVMLETPEVREAFESVVAGLDAELVHMDNRKRAAAAVSLGLPKEGAGD